MPWTSEFEISTTTVAERPESERPGSRGSSHGVVREAPGERVRPRHRSGVARARQNPRSRKSHSNRRAVYRRRRIAALFVMLVLCAAPVALAFIVLPGLSLPGLSMPGSSVGQSNAAFARVEPPLLSTAPTIVGTEEETTSEAPPEDKTLSLTVPKLGLYGQTVENDDSAEALDSGAIKIPETGFPWQEGANTYISGHRIGYAGTESYYQFLNLPSMKKGDEVILEDANGERYTYRVFEVFAVEPTDVWVTEPVAGKDVVTLQTCTESVEDWKTLGPELLYSTPDTGRLIVQAERI